MKDKYRKSLTSTFWILVCSSVGVLCISAIDSKKHNTLNEVVVEVYKIGNGNHFLTSDDVREEILAVTGPAAQATLRDVQPDQIENALHHNPFIRKADVFVSSNGSINAKILQREPLVRVLENSGNTYYLDREAQLVPVSPHFTARVLVATGEFPETGKDFMQSMLFQLSSAIDKHDFCQPLIEQIHFSGGGEITLIPKIGPRKIEFGSADHIDEKLLSITKFYKEVLPAKGWDAYKSISLKYKNQIVCKKNQSK